MGLRSLFVNLNTSSAQYWSKHYDLQKANDNGRKIILIDDGMVVLVNGFCEYNTMDCFGLMKFDFEGNLIWKAVALDTLDVNHGEAIEVINDTIFVNANYLDVPNKHYCVIAFNMQGNYLSRRDYEYPGLLNYHWAREIAALGDRRFVTFQYRDTATGRYMGRLRAFDNNWNIVWERSISNFYPHVGWCEMEPTPDGGAAMIYSSCQTYHCRASIEKYDASGGLEWTTVFPKDYNSATWVDLAVHPDGGYVGFWRIDTFGIFIYPYPELVFKLDAAGQFEWQKVRFDRAQNFWQVFAAQNGDIIACGVAQDFYQDTIDYFAGLIRRLKPNGETRWERKIFDYTDGGIRNQFFYGVEMPNGDLVFSGDIRDTLPDDPYPGNVWLVKLDSNGCFTPGCGEEQYLVAAKEPQQAVEEQPFALFPNPFSDHITLAAVLGRHIPPGEYRAVLYDAQGQIIRQQSFSPNLLTYFDTEDAPPGAYILAVYKDGVLMQTLKAVKP